MSDLRILYNSHTYSINDLLCSKYFILFSFEIPNIYILFQDWMIIWESPIVNNKEVSILEGVRLRRFYCDSNKLKKKSWRFTVRSSRSSWSSWSSFSTWLYMAGRKRWPRWPRWPDDLMLFCDYNYFSWILSNTLRLLVDSPPRFLNFQKFSNIGILIPTPSPVN